MPKEENLEAVELQKIIDSNKLKYESELLEQTKKFKLESEELKSKHKNTIQANERLAKKTNKKDSEVVEKDEDILRLENELSNFRKIISETQDTALKAKQQNDKNILLEAIKKSGFESADLLINKFELDKLVIQDGVIEGFAVKVEELKKEYPKLYVDGSTSPTNNNTVNVSETQNSVSTLLNGVIKKLSEGETLTQEESTIAIFGGINKK